MTKIEITVEDYEYHCGDGCCSEYGEKVTYEVDEVITGEYKIPDFDSHTAETLLMSLGYEVDDSYNYMEDSYVITAEKVNDSEEKL